MNTITILLVLFALVVVNYYFMQTENFETRQPPVPPSRELKQNTDTSQISQTRTIGKFLPVLSLIILAIVG